MGGGWIRWVLGDCRVQVDVYVVVVEEEEGEYPDGSGIPAILR